MRQNRWSMMATCYMLIYMSLSWNVNTQALPSCDISTLGHTCFTGLVSAPVLMHLFALQKCFWPTDWFWSLMGLPCVQHRLLCRHYCSQVVTVQIITLFYGRFVTKVSTALKNDFYLRACSEQVLFFAASVCGLTSFSVWRCIFRISRSPSGLKVTGLISRSWSQITSRRAGLCSPQTRFNYSFKTGSHLWIFKTILVSPMQPKVEAEL